MKRSRGKIAGTVLLILAAVIAVTCVWYISNYYQASDEVRFYLSSSESVSFQNTDQGILLDGPSDECAMVFYPGGKVEYTAYLPMLWQIAENGTDVFLVRMPANLAVFGKNKADSIMEHWNYKRWYIAGHSLGGVMAADYVAETERQVDGLILLAAYPIKPLPQIPLLDLYGSNDLVLNRDKLKETEEYLPKDAVVMEIPGGNHAQFGNYGEQEGDGIADITRQVQQEVTIRMILEMTGNR